MGEVTLKPDAARSLPQRVQSLMENNGPMMFPNGGEPYRSGWTPPAVPDDVRAELPDLIDLHVRALQPARREQIAILLSQLQNHFPPGDRKPAEARLLLEDYIADLAEIPLDILQAACAGWRQSEMWFPRVSQLLAIATPQLSKRREELFRLCRLAGRSVSRAVREQPEQTRAGKPVTVGAAAVDVTRNVKRR